MNRWGQVCRASSLKGLFALALLFGFGLAMWGPAEDSGIGPSSRLDRELSPSDEARSETEGLGYQEVGPAVAEEIPLTPVRKGAADRGWEGKGPSVDGVVLAGGKGLPGVRVLVQEMRGGEFHRWGAGRTTGSGEFSIRSHVGLGVESPTNGLAQRPDSLEEGAEVEREERVFVTVDVQGFSPWHEEGPIDQEWRIEVFPNAEWHGVDISVEDDGGVPIEEFEVSAGLRSIVHGASGRRDWELDWMRTSAPGGVARLQVTVQPDRGPFELSVKVRATGYQPARELAVWPDDPGPLKVVMKPGRVLTGRVLQEGKLLGEHAPVGGASVLVMSGEGRALARTTSQEDGSFELSPFDRDRAAELFAFSEGLAPTRVPIGDWGAGAEVVDVILLGGIRWRGILRDADGRPMPDVLLQVPVDAWEALSPLPRFRLSRARTEEGGQFEFQGLAVGTWPVEHVVSPAPGSPSIWIEDVTLQGATEHSQDLVMQGGGRVHGTFQLPKGVEGGLVFVQVFREAESGDPFAAPLARWVGSKSPYSIEGVPHGPCVVRLVARPGHFVEHHLDVSGGETEVPPFSFPRWSDYAAWAIPSKGSSAGD